MSDNRRNYRWAIIGKVPKYHSVSPLEVKINDVDIRFIEGPSGIGGGGYALYRALPL
jgi:hypothetical protein